MKAEPQKPKMIIDTNKHGIRREMPASGYKTNKALKKKQKVSHETK
jgi:hypothetical protein